MYNILENIFSISCHHLFKRHGGDGGGALWDTGHIRTYAFWDFFVHQKLESVG